MKLCQKSLYLFLTINFIYGANFLYAQEAFRKEWSNFQGYNGAYIPSAQYSGEVSSASNVNLENGVIETALGITTVATTQGTNAIYGFVPYENTSKQTLVYWSANAGSWQEMTTGLSTSYLGYTVGTSSQSGTTVYGSGTDWTTNIKSGDDWKCAADADSAYINIATVVSASSLTLTSNYTGGCTTSSAYNIRKTFAISGTRPYYTGSNLNGWALLLTGDDTAEMYNGTDLFTNVSVGSPAVVATHKNRWFTANIAGSPDTVYWSPVNSTAAWNATALEPVFSADGSGGIVGLISDDSSIVIFKRYGKIYRMFGEFSTAVGRPDSILEVPIPFTLGQVALRTIKRYNNAIWFVTSTGLYSLRGNEIKLMGRNFEPQINYVCSEALVCTPAQQQSVYSGIFKNRMYINFDNVVGIIDSGGNAVLRSAGNAMFGGFANFNQNFYASSAETSNLRILQLETEGNFSNYNTSNSTSSANINYISESYCGEAPELKKDFKDIYVLYEESASSATVGLNELLVDTLIDDTSNYMSVSSITTNGVAGRISQYQYRVGTKGNCLKWRIRENSRGMRNRIVKVILRGNYLGLR